MKTSSLDNITSRQQGYVGRFAPSPSGPLHFGSLITALGSYLRARQNNGKWLLRIDDIDPPREMPGAKEIIVESLQYHGLHWDGEVIYQSQRAQRYHEVLDTLTARGQSYRCQCTRKQIKLSGGHYQGTCRALDLNGEDLSVRFRNDCKLCHITDGLLGEIAIDPIVAQEDFVIWRKDGLVAYNLASVVDDIDFAVSEVVRGADLLAPSACQNALFTALSAYNPDYIHLPVAATREGFKLSKQNHASAIDNKQAVKNLQQALLFLGVPEIPEGPLKSVSSLLSWAIENWRLDLVEKTQEIIVTGD